VQVSVCIVNYNNRELLARCLDSVLSQSRDVPIEVLVADNGSTDDSVAWLRREHPEVRLFENANIGFSRANNQLVKHAQGSMILLLNNDCVLEKDNIRVLLDLMDKDHRIGILGCKILTGQGFLQPTCMSISPWCFLLPGPVELYRARSLTFGANFDKVVTTMKAYEARHGYDRLREVDWVSGVCVLIRRKVLETIGMLDEMFFMYYEDADFCLRARKAGWKVVYTPAASARHFIRQLSGKPSSTRLLIEARHSQYNFMRKHYGRAWAALLLLRYFLQLAVAPLFAIAQVPRALLLRRSFSFGMGWQTKALRKILSA